MNKWNKKNALRVLLYAVLYAVGTILVCVTGSFHPVFFVCYQITAGILLSGITITGFRRVQSPRVAACLFFCRASGTTRLRHYKQGLLY